MTDATPGTPSILTTCRGITKGGAPCQGRFLGPTGFCLFHDPDRAEERLEFRRKGAQAARASRAAKRKREASLLELTSGPRPPVGDSLEELVGWLRWNLEANARGELHRADLSARTMAARALQGAFERRDMQKQLREAQRKIQRLEDALAKSRRGT